MTSILALIVVLGVTVVVFVVTRMIGDPVSLMLPMESTPEQRAAFDYQGMLGTVVALVTVPNSGIPVTRRNDPRAPPWRFFVVVQAVRVVFAAWVAEIAGQRAGQPVPVAEQERLVEVVSLLEDLDRLGGRRASPGERGDRAARSEIQRAVDHEARNEQGNDERGQAAEDEPEHLRPRSSVDRGE